MSPFTWAALSALVLVLGGLAVFLMGCNQVLGLDQTKLGLPNFYTCECSCAGFGAGAIIAPTAAIINVYDSPTTQNVVGVVSPAAQGTISGDPQQAPLNGVDQTWWFAAFTGGVSGFVVQSQVSVVTGAPFFTKDFQVCVIPAEDPNQGGTRPTQQQLESDCSTDRVAPNLASLLNQAIPPGAQCGCTVTSGSTQWGAECESPCTDPTGVCLLARSDPDPPAPDPLSTSLFSTTSICQVTDGTATISVGGHSPLTPPKVHGVMQIHGRPCPGGGCTVGLGYQFTFDDIEFDSGSIFASNPKFVDLSITGATLPDAIAISPLFGISAIPANTALTSANGRRAGTSDKRVIVLQNSQDIAFGVNWDTKVCLFTGTLSGAVIGDNNQTGNVDIELTGVTGIMVNQPPVPNAGQAQTVECTSPAGAPITLDASASTDLDNNISYFIWRRDSDTGPLVGDPSASPVRHTTQAIGSKNYSVRVVDGELASDTAVVTVNVVDTKAPVIDCHAPATVTPPAAPVSFTATATDTCSATPPAVVIDNVQCQHPKPNGTVEDWKSCKVTTQGNTITIANTGGVNGLIRWLAHATDGAGNTTTQQCQVSVVNPGKGN